MKVINLFGRTVTATQNLQRDLLAVLLRESLSGISIDTLVSMVITHVGAILQFSRLCAGARQGKNISLLFNPHRLDTRCNDSKQTLFHAITTDANFRSGLSRVMIAEHNRGATDHTIFYHCLQLGVNGVTLPREFPPNVARDIYCNAKYKGSQLRILDPCAGWGGRMIGAASVGAYYEAWEPSTATYNGLIKLGRWLEKFDTGFKFVLHHEPFEDSTIPSKKFDIALTSPPYYDTEIYSDESTNSLNRYDTFDEWVQGFYHPMIHSAMGSLRGGCSFILNVGERQYPLAKELKATGYLVKPMKSLLSGASGLGRKHGKGEQFFVITRKKV